MMKHYLSEIKHLNRRSYVLTICSGLGTFVAVGVIDRIFARIGLPAEATIIDNILLGLAVAVLVFVLEVQHLLAEHKRKLKVVLQMNHHIRNALQTIMYENSMNPDRTAAERVAKATARIEWALREIRTFETEVLEMPQHLNLGDGALKQKSATNR
jgi:hypothetical protein